MLKTCWEKLISLRFSRKVIFKATTSILGWVFLTLALTMTLIVTILWNILERDGWTWFG